MDIGICIQRNIDKEENSLRWIFFGRCIQRYIDEEEASLRWILVYVSREILIKKRIL